MNNYQVDYSVGALGNVQLTVSMELKKTDENFEEELDKLCVAEIIKEVTDYGAIRSID